MASPLARRMAAESGLQLRAVVGSGPGGRIVKRDVERHGRGGGPRLDPAPRAAARKLQWKSWVDAGAILDAVASVGEGLEVSPVDFVVMACSWALRRMAGIAEAARADVDLEVEVVERDRTVWTKVRNADLIGLRAVRARRETANAPGDEESLSHDGQGPPPFSITIIEVEGLDELSGNLERGLHFTVGGLRGRFGASGGPGVLVSLSADSDQINMHAGSELLSAFRRALEAPLTMIL